MTVNDFYFDYCERYGCDCQAQHITAMWAALNWAHAYGICSCDITPNGDGVIYQLDFGANEAPRFSCTSDDVFRQIQIL